MRPKKDDDEKLRHPISLRLNDRELEAVKSYEEDWSINPTAIARLALFRFLKQEGYLGTDKPPSGLWKKPENYNAISSPAKRKKKGIK